MLVRQAIIFKLNGQYQSDCDGLAAGIARLLLADYGDALGLREVVSFDHMLYDYNLSVGFCASWRAPDNWLDAINSGEVFSRTPVIGQHRPRLNDEMMQGMEIVVELDALLLTGKLRHET